MAGRIGNEMSCTPIAGVCASNSTQALLCVGPQVLATAEAALSLKLQPPRLTLDGFLSVNQTGGTLDANTQLLTDVSELGAVAAELVSYNPQAYSHLNGTVIGRLGESELQLQLFDPTTGVYKQAGLGRATVDAGLALRQDVDDSKLFCRDEQALPSSLCDAIDSLQITFANHTQTINDGLSETEQRFNTLLFGENGLLDYLSQVTETSYAGYTTDLASQAPFTSIPSVDNLAAYQASVTELKSLIQTLPATLNDGRRYLANVRETMLPVIQRVEAKILFQTQQSEANAETVADAKEEAQQEVDEFNQEAITEMVLLGLALLVTHGIIRSIAKTQAETTKNQHMDAVFSTLCSNPDPELSLTLIPVRDRAQKEDQVRKDLQNTLVIFQDKGPEEDMFHPIVPDANKTDLPALIQSGSRNTEVVQLSGIFQNHSQEIAQLFRLINGTDIDSPKGDKAEQNIGLREILPTPVFQMLFPKRLLRIKTPHQLFEIYQNLTKYQEAFLERIKINERSTLVTDNQTKLRLTINTLSSILKNIGSIYNGIMSEEGDVGTGINSMAKSRAFGGGLFGWHTASTSWFKRSHKMFPVAKLEVDDLPNMEITVHQQGQLAAAAAAVVGTPQPPRRGAFGPLQPGAAVVLEMEEPTDLQFTSLKRQLDNGSNA